MRTEDLDVRQKLIEAGYSALGVESRGDLFEILAQILSADPAGNGELVDRLRAALVAAEELDGWEELEQARADHPCIKACPECGQRPDFGYLVDSTDDIFVSCICNGSEAIAQGGTTLSLAIANWNRDDWIGADVVRGVFPL